MKHGFSVLVLFKLSKNVGVSYTPKNSNERQIMDTRNLTKCANSGANPIFARLGPLWFFPIPQDQGGDQGDPIFWCGGHQKSRDDGAPEDSRRSLPGGASKHGKRGWTSVWDWRETILKGTSCDFNIFFGIKFIWSQSRYFLDGPCISIYIDRW